MLFLQMENDNGQNDDDDGWILKRKEIFAFENNKMVISETNIEINVQCIYVCVCLIDSFANQSKKCNGNISLFDSKHCCNVM